jgi:2-polyprenyl-6-methoxyphenol hydroxylase-like FAD-dependent oxidoreductase
MRVLISGGGIAGLTLAYWLHQYHIPAVVIEQATGIRRDGYAIDFMGTGYDVAERMGIIDTLHMRQNPFESLVYVNRTGKPIARLDAALLHTVTNGKYLGLMHSTLEEVLYEELAEQVEVRFARWITAIDSGPNEVAVTFNDGTTESFDVLIGADGVHSTTRALTFGPQEQFSRYLGCTIACYRLADRYDIGSTYRLYNEPGRQILAYGISQEREILALFLYQSAKPEYLPREQRLARLREVCTGMGWLTQQFLSDASPSTNVFMDAVTQIQMPTWHQGRVALVGDACDCPTLFSGQGASMAMGGAYLLAQALSECADYRQAFQRYEQQMFAYAQAQQKSARGIIKSFLPDSSLSLLMQQMMIKVVLRPMFRALLGRVFGVQSLLLPQESRSAQRSATSEQRLS